MKSLMQLLHVVLNDMGTRCRTSTIRDFKTITERVEHEGLSFLTITLPDFCSDLQKGLDQSFVSSDLFLSFKKKGRLPLFLGGFVRLVFNSDDGQLLAEPDIDAIQAIRQITLLYSKILLPCSDARERNAIVKFSERERQIRLNDKALSSSDKDDFEKIVIKFLAPVLRKVDHDVYYGALVPKHGPGSTADRLTSNGKYNLRSWTRRLEESFPHGEFLYPSWSHFCDSDSVDLSEPGQEQPVRVVLVPKTLKTPRVIAIEPACMQYAQQAVMESLVRHISGTFPTNMTIGFDDQVPNRNMARLGSISQDLATLDLSEASDSVSNQLVKIMLHKFPHLGEAVEACRSRKADVPGKGIQRLAKFASMGSALCFPMEALVFYTIVLLGIERELGRPLRKKDVKFLSSQVRIFGDDIIVPAEYVRSVVVTLETFGFRVNSDKSFWTGKFRESCGKEYYDGHDVSIVKCRRTLPSHRRHVQELISFVSFRNQMYFAGNWATVRYVDGLLERIIPFPFTAPTSPALGRHSFMGYETQRLCPYLHKPLVSAYVPYSRLPSDILDGPGALLKFFLKRGDEPFNDGKHLERAGRPKGVGIKRRWAPSY